MSDNDDDFSDETRQISFVGLPDRSLMKEQPYLIVLSGSRIGAMMKVVDGMTIGRSPGAALQVIDDGVSRYHVRLYRDAGGKIHAEDQGSRNGTYVNGDRITDRSLEDGDKILIGTTTILKFSYSDRFEESFQQQMFNAALRDPLTNLYNRRHLDERLQGELSFAFRHGSSLSLIMADIDHFKAVNDTYGHPIGDAVVISVANSILGAVRTEDMVARYGGEEFAVLMRGTKVNMAETVADRIRRLVEESEPVSEQPELRITLSAGVAGIPDPSIGTVEQLIQAADDALYAAKAAGRNRVCLYDPDLATKPLP